MDCIFHGVTKRWTRLSDIYFQPLHIVFFIYVVENLRWILLANFKFITVLFTIGEGMATHSSILPCRSPWTEKPDELQLMGSQRVRHE